MLEYLSATALASFERTSLRLSQQRTREIVQLAVTRGLTRWRPPEPCSLTLLHRFEPSDLSVPADHATVQEAVNAAKSGDRIALAPGLHEGHVRVEGKAVLIFEVQQCSSVACGSGCSPLHAHMHVVQHAASNSAAHTHSQSGQSAPCHRPAIGGGAMAAEDDDVLDLSGDALLAIDGTLNVQRPWDHSLAGGEFVFTSPLISGCQELVLRDSRSYPRGRLVGPLCREYGVGIEATFI